MSTWSAVRWRASPPRNQDGDAPGLAEGRSWLAFALSENGSGSDAASLTTRAVDRRRRLRDRRHQDVDHRREQAKYILTAVRTDRTPRSTTASALFLVPTERRAWTIRPIDLLGGMRSAPAKSTTSVRVPRRLMVGELAHGLETADRGAGQGACRAGGNVHRRGAGRSRPGALVCAGARQFGQPCSTSRPCRTCWSTCRRRWMRRA